MDQHPTTDMDITNYLQRLANLWHGHPGATNQALNAIEAQMKLQFPPDFKKFMLWSNGGEAKLPAVYLAIWEVENMVALNRAYQIQNYLGEKILGIGSDGGPICFRFDYRDGLDAKFASVNFGDLDVNEIKNIAPSFTDALAMAIDGRLVGDEL